MIHHFKTRFSRIAVHAGDGAQPHKLQLILEELAHAHDFPGRDLDGQLAPVELAGYQCIRVESFYARRGGVLFNAFWKHAVSLWFPYTVARPVQGALFPDVEKPGKHQNNKDKHLAKGEHLQLAVDHRPWIQKNRLD